MMANCLSALERREFTAGDAERETRMPRTRKLLLVVFREIGLKCVGERFVRRPLFISLRSSATSAVNPFNLAGILTGRDMILSTDRPITTAEGLTESGDSEFLPTTIGRMHPRRRAGSPPPRQSSAATLS